MSVNNDWVKSYKKKKSKSLNVNSLSDFELIESYLTEQQKERYQAVRLKSNKYRNESFLNDFKDEMVVYHSNKIDALREVTKPFYQKAYFFILLFLLLIFVIYL